jgi:hypothetical protein
MVPGEGVEPLQPYGANTPLPTKPTITNKLINLHQKYKHIKIIVVLALPSNAKMAHEQPKAIKKERTLPNTLFKNGGLRKLRMRYKIGLASLSSNHASCLSSSSLG